MPAQVWIVAPRKKRGDPLEDLRSEIFRFYEGRGWSVRTLRARDAPSRARSESGRRYRVLEPVDAYQLYGAIHRLPAAVYQLRQTQVLKDPMAGPVERNVLPLEQFVRYKAAFVTASVELPWADSVDAVDAWIESSSCDGEQDARCLPLHTFCPHEDWRGIDNDQTEFERAHGKSGRRVDDRARPWPKDKSYHAKNDVDIVAGHEFHPGFHWDVQAARNTSKIRNAKEVWSLGRDGHINVYPDSTIRGGHHCEQLYEAERPAPAVTGGPRQPQRVGRSRNRSR